MYEVDDPPALNVQHSGASSHGPTAPLLLTYTWQRLVDEQFNGDLRRSLVQLR
jgi:hypothetical protein